LSFFVQLFDRKNALYVQETYETGESGQYFITILFTGGETECQHLTS
jgi:hypothetical protein